MKLPSILILCLYYSSSSKLTEQKDGDYHHISTIPPLKNIVAKAQASSADEHILDTKPGHPRINSERYTCRDYVADECNDDEPFSDKLGNNQRPRRCKISEMERKEPYLTIGISVVRENNRRYGSDSKADKGGSNTRDNPWLFLESHFVSDGC
ncbi:unnamed protein product [Aspergillus oryzae var. brunneus]|uniref:Unnamed protein product n=2 Tax=Aspergillus oryzae TaxID=5062 RepID=A0AAN4Y9M4_ASPOZ|nr:unnamed protein product [Aspergillus oryzae]GMG24708.1 unnamed protein product [Aspergillus oryzae]GMG50347.1 unnamed protein product [Aspergillus oryzae var. brunneus]